MSEFKISIIIAVYNTEKYLEETIKSIIDQSIGFDQIQLVLVDDGSTDGSRSICEEYAGKYPNIMALHKDNGGVSSARNFGLQHATGKYVNFLDSDDKLSANTCEKVFCFMEEHQEIDVAAIPMVFFDKYKGDHPLNFKFKKGSRIIDLETEWDAPQMSFASAFARLEAFKENTFNEELAYAEDSELLQKILLQKYKYGVISEARYLYRKRSSGAFSALQRSRDNPKWYLPTIVGFEEAVIGYCLKKTNSVPLFVQFALMYDIESRLKVEDISSGIVEESAQKEYYKHLFSVLKYIDDEVILRQRTIDLVHKLFAIKKKYNSNPTVVKEDNDVIFSYNNTSFFRLSQCETHYEFLKINDSQISVEGHVSIPCGLLDDNVSIYVVTEDGKFKCDETFIKPTTACDETIAENCRFYKEFTFHGNKASFYVAIEYKGEYIPLIRESIVDEFFPVGNLYNNCYYYKDGICISWDNGKLLAVKENKLTIKRREIAFLKEIWKRNLFGGHKAVFIKIIVNILKYFKRKPLWLVSDRVLMADDNGEALFVYLREKHKEIDARFVINSGCQAFESLKQYGKVIDKKSHQFKILHLLSDYIISSQAETEMYNPFRGYHDPYRNILADTRFVFLQHGVIKDDISWLLNRNKKNFFSFVTSAPAERQSILDCPYGYKPEQIWLTGLPRFDRLYHDEKKQITIMPTWRMKLTEGFDQSTGEWKINPSFHTSKFKAFYVRLLNDQRLLDTAERLGYHLSVMMHPNLRASTPFLVQDERVTVLDSETTYRTVFAQSDLILTDYSSVVFDFVYLKKPIIYAQFDKDEFYCDSDQYDIGYFDYERDGFGEVEYTVEDTVDRIIEYMENGCRLKDFYAKRIESFFYSIDRNNCERVYQKLLENGIYNS